MNILIRAVDRALASIKRYIYLYGLALFIVLAGFFALVIHQYRLGMCLVLIGCLLFIIASWMSMWHITGELVERKPT